jgi:hypothetical protein
MSKPSEPTREEMLNNLDLIEGWVYNLLEESTFSEAQQRRITKKILAWGQPIRRLIEKHEEWTKRAGQIMAYGKDETKRLLELEEFARTIRDFGKGGA